MGSSVVRSDDLNVYVKISPIELVLDSQVGEMNALIEVRQVVLARPVLDLVRGSIRPAVAVRAIPIALLEEALVVAFELLLENDTADLRALVSQARLFGPVRAVDLCVM